MSDTGRKGVGEQLKEKATPQDQKVHHHHIPCEICANLHSHTPNKPLRLSLAHTTESLLPSSQMKTNLPHKLLQTQSVAVQMMPRHKERVLLIRQRRLPTISSAVTPTLVAKIIRVFRREFRDGM
jgi:hypothetical protein